MSLFVECKPDETLAFALGIPRREVEHAGNRAGVCKQVSSKSDMTGMVDEDPETAPLPYMKTMVEKVMEHQLRVLFDAKRNNRLVVICPRLEDWLVQTAKSAGLKLTDFGFDSDNGRQLHGQINHRLENLDRLVKKLLLDKNARILLLQKLISQCR
jgi:hypothetical protein